MKNVVKNSTKFKNYEVHILRLVNRYPEKMFCIAHRNESFRKKMER